MNQIIDLIEKWLIKAIVVQLFFLLTAQFLLSFDRFIPYLNKAIASEGVIDFLKPSAKAVFVFFAGS